MIIKYKYIKKILFIRIINIDYIKIKEFDDNQIKCLKVLLDINESDKFLAEITKIYD